MDVFEEGLWSFDALLLEPGLGLLRHQRPLVFLVFEELEQDEERHQRRQYVPFRLESCDRLVDIARVEAECISLRREAVQQTLALLGPVPRGRLRPNQLFKRWSLDLRLGGRLGLFVTGFSLALFCLRLRHRSREVRTPLCGPCCLIRHASWCSVREALCLELHWRRCLIRHAHRCGA